MHNKKYTIANNEDTSVSSCITIKSFLYSELTKKTTPLKSTLQRC